MRNSDALGDRARIVDVLAGAARALAVHGGAMIVELQGDADDVVTLLLEQRGRDGGIDAARHGDHDARVLRPALDLQRIQHHAVVPGRPARAAPAHGRLSIKGVDRTQCGTRPARQFLPPPQQAMPGSDRGPRTRPWQPLDSPKTFYPVRAGPRLAPGTAS